MKNAFKYVTTGEEDQDWGLYLKVVGISRIPSYVKEYPSSDHPMGYNFSWENGRVLQEYQINYITKGAGVLENEYGTFQIKPGTIIITRPGAWHRYRPSQQYGWDENYIGFCGELADHFLNKPLFPPERCLINCGIHEEIIDVFYKIHDFVEQEKPGFQQIVSGLIVKLLGHIISWQKQRNFSGKRIEELIQKARFHMRENIEADIDLRDMAESYNVGYSHFRKMFKKYTGISPHQYHLDLKLVLAKELILSTNMSIKEIGYKLGFKSEHYFSRVFKAKIGRTPSEIRKYNTG